jgi:hypothetical protein
MKKYISFALLISTYYFNFAVAQTIPADLKPIFPQRNGKSFELRSTKPVTEAQRKFLDADTTRSKEGYLILEVSSDYLKQLEIIDITRHIDSTKSNSGKNFMGLAFLGKKQEGPKRATYFYGGRGQAEAMITIWRFKEAGASIVAFEEYINQSILGLKGTLTLAKNSDSEKCLWKYTGNNEDILYEITLTDYMSQGSPSLSVSQVKSEIEKMIGIAREEEQI